jgi:hypothetical protein
MTKEIIPTSGIWSSIASKLNSNFDQQFDAPEDIYSQLDLNGQSEGTGTGDIQVEYALRFRKGQIICVYFSFRKN